MKLEKREEGREKKGTQRCGSRGRMKKKKTNKRKGSRREECKDIDQKAESKRKRK